MNRASSTESCGHGEGGPGREESARVGRRWRVGGLRSLVLPASSSPVPDLKGGAGQSLQAMSGSLG